MYTRCPQTSSEANVQLATLADAAQAAANKAGAAIDAALHFIAASNKRIAAMEAKAAKRDVGRRGLCPP